MTGLDVLRRVVTRARAGKAQRPEDLDELEAAIAGINAGTPADKALGLRRGKAGRPAAEAFALGDLEAVATVLTITNSGVSLEDALERVPVPAFDLKRKVQRYRGFVRWLAANGIALDTLKAKHRRMRQVHEYWDEMEDQAEDPPPPVDRPSARDDFLDT